MPEESHLVFRGSASLECCCFISNDEFLSGSDDGSVMLWNTLRKKPAFIVKNAHAAYSPNGESNAKEDGVLNGDYAGIKVFSLSFFNTYLLCQCLWFNTRR